MATAGSAPLKESLAGGRSGSARKERDSNLELMRIVLMLLIIAHHYVVNSGVMDLWDMQTLTPNAVFLELWGMWGKVCINAFVMITGYFMCTSRLTWVKVAKLFGMIYFYKVVLGAVFLATGWMGIVDFAKLLMTPFRMIDGGFTASFMVMYLTIPFLNTLLGALSKAQLRKLLALLLSVFTICTTFFASSTAFSEVGWYITLYLIAAYIRLYPARWFGSTRATGCFLTACIALSYLSVIVVMAASSALGIEANHAYWFVSDSGKLMAFLTGAAIFLFFKNLDLGQSKVINKVSATVFGVLLIHANSDAMREWLWGYVVDVQALYLTSPLPLLIVESVFTALVVFAACSAIDMLRIRFVEKPVFAKVSANKERIEGWFLRRTAGLRSIVDKVV